MWVNTTFVGGIKVSDNRPKITDAEWEVMKVLWEESPLPFHAIQKKLEPRANWKPNTIHTLISRLVKKNVIGLEKKNSRYLYYPLSSQEECSLKETESFIKKVYDGSLSMLVANFISENKLSPEEAQKLRELLDKEHQEKGED